MLYYFTYIIDLDILSFQTQSVTSDTKYSDKQADRQTDRHGHLIIHLLMNFSQTTFEKRLQN